MSRWKWLLLIQAAAAMVAVVMPVTPNRPGSDWSMAELVFPDPSYFEEVVVYFVLANLMILLMGAVLFVWVRVGGRRG